MSALAPPPGPAVGAREWREVCTVGDLLVRGAALTGATEAGVVTPAGRATWSEVLAGAERVADELAGHGLGHGSRVGLLVDNSVSGLRALFGVLLLGAVAVPVNTRFAAPEVRHVLDDSRVTAVLLTDHADSPDGFPALLRRAAEGRPSWGLTGVLVGSEGAVGPDAAGLISVPCTPAAEPAAVAARVAAARHRVAVRDPALVVHTSGTTARPKGCPLSHEVLVGVARAVGRDRFRCTADDVLWDVLPLFHLSFVLPLLAVLDAGGGFVTDRRFDPVRALAQIRDTRVTVAFTCFPTVIDALLERPDFDAVFDGVRLMLNVGPPPTLAAIQRRAPGTVQITSYGSSEVGGIAATTSPDDPDENPPGHQRPPAPRHGRSVSSTPRASSGCPTASAARSSCAAPGWPTATRTTPARPPGRAPPAAGSAPATSARSAPAGASATTAGSRR